MDENPDLCVYVVAIWVKDQRVHDHRIDIKRHKRLDKENHK